MKITTKKRGLEGGKGAWQCTKRRRKEMFDNEAYEDFYDDEYDEERHEITAKEEAFEAVKESFWALKYVSKELITPELCLEAVRGIGENGVIHDYSKGLALQHVPEELKTLELCLMAVRTMPYALKFVPEELKSQVKAMLEVCGTFTDPRDGKAYKTVKIGEQVWMAENLNLPEKC